MKTGPWRKAVSAACLFLAVGVVSAKKKSDEKPVLERFQATMSPVLTCDNYVSISIEKYSTADEKRELAHAYASGGDGGLLNALHKVKKGYFTISDSDASPLLVTESTSQGMGRKLTIIGMAPEGAGWLADTEHRGYPYTYIQIEVDDQGKGQGVLLPFVNVVFDKQGVMVIKPISQGKIRLVNVSLEK